MKKHWLFRLFGKRKRFVRMHLKDLEGSIEGLLVWRLGTHYVLAKVNLLESDDNVTDLGNSYVYIHKSQVVFYQTI